MQNDRERMKITYSEIGRRQKKRKVEVTTLGPSTSIVEEDPGTVYVNNGNETGCSKEELQERVTSEAKKQVCILNNVFSWSLLDRSASRRATQALAELSKDEDAVSVIVDAGAIPALVKHLKEPEFVPDSEVHGGIRHFEYEVEKGSAVALGFLAIKPEYQQLIVDAGALPLLVNLLNKHNDDFNSRTLSSVIRRVADTITNLAHENNVIKSAVRCEGGIPPLVKLLDFADIKVRKSSAGALRTLAFKNDDNKNLIVQCNALPSLILMLRSEDEDIHYEAVGVIGNLVHSSPVIKKQVLREGALQPVIRLLSSACKDSQREAALLVGQFAATDSECKVHVVQRGAVYPLIDMLESLDPHLIEMSAFAIGRLAQETHNQAGIVYAGGLIPLLKLLGSKNGSLQHNAAFALYGLADNEDNVSDFIKVGAVQTLQDGDFTVQATKDCVGKTLKRLEEKINGRVLKHLLYLMSVPDIIIRRYIALSLAHLCSPEDQNTIFITNNGIELLLGLFRSTNLKQQKDASMALYKLAKKSMSVSPLDYVPPSPTTPQVYLGEKYVNSPTLSDVTFLVEGKRFFAHRIALLASSDAFRAMFDGGYREKNATDIEIPNIKWEAFELMMRFIYTGTAEITMNVAHDLLQASDQYLLEGLKRLSEYTIAQNISDDNVGSVYEISESCNALSLRHTCILFILEHFRQISAKSGYNHLIQRIIPDIRNIFTKSFKPIPIKSKITEEPPYVDNNDVIVLDI